MRFRRLRSEERGLPGPAGARRPWPVTVLLALMALGAATAWVQEGAPQGLDIAFPPHGTIRWERGGRPLLEVMPMPGDGWIALSRRYLGESDGTRLLRGANDNLRSPERNRPVLIPIVALRPEFRLDAVRRLFPADTRTADGWQHWVLDPFGGGEESWGWLAELFTGTAERAAALERANPALRGSGPRRGAPVTIPGALLLPVFSSVPPAATPTPRPTTVPGDDAAVILPVRTPPNQMLEFGRDAAGEYAVYRLKRGEALYSAVVVRFTGQLLAEQVNETAMEIAARSGIRDVTDIPVGYPVKVPLDLLLPEFLPATHPRRQAWLENREELGRFLEVVRATDLSGVHIVLDAGHGGNDTGALSGGVWESTYAYDIMCRIKANLERHTRATVWTTIEHGRVGFKSPPRDRLEQHRDAQLLTRPRYRLEDSVLGVHLRWYLTNDIILNRIGSEVPRAKTVFLSVHADSLHPSVRGAMIYVPSRYLRPSKPYTVKHREIARYAEYRNHPTVTLGENFKARVEASSRYFAESIISSLEANEIGVHPYEPIRDRILRGRSSWVPAVLRYTAAQNAVLLEACNMANAEDRALLLQAAWRERFARAVVEGMAAAFAE